MDKKYTAIGVVYPTKSNLMKNVVDDPDFGYQIHTERLIQLFKSQTMRNEMVHRLKLIEYYHLDTLKPNWVHNLKTHYQQDITINRSKYLSVEITAELKDPHLAAKMVNNMISYVDTIRRDIFLENTQIWVNDLKPKIGPQQHIVDSLLLAIDNYDQKRQSNLLSKDAISQIKARRENGNSLAGDHLIQNSLEQNYSVGLEKLISHYYRELGILNRFQSDLISAQEKLSLPFPKIYTVMRAEVDDKKTSPSKTINGLISLIMGFIFGITFFVFKDNFTQIRDRIKA